MIKKRNEKTKNKNIRDSNEKKKIIKMKSPNFIFKKIATGSF